MELPECSSFVQRATAQFKQLALEHHLIWEHRKKYFWIRLRDGTEVLQGNFVTDWLRPFMHDLRPGELQRLNQWKLYKDHCKRGGGHRFYIRTQDDIDVVKAIVLARCGG